MEVVSGDNWSDKTCKAPVKMPSPTNQHQLSTGSMPFLSPNQQCQSIEGKISHSADLLTPSSPGVLQLCLWPLIAPGYLWGGLPCLSSALWCQYPGWLWWTYKSNLKQTPTACCVLCLHAYQQRLKSPTCKLAAPCDLPQDETERVDVSASVGVEVLRLQRVVENFRRQVAHGADATVRSYVDGIGRQIMSHCQP